MLDGDVLFNVELSAMHALYGFKYTAIVPYYFFNDSDSRHNTIDNNLKNETKKLPRLNIDRTGKATLPRTVIRMEGKGLPPSGALVLQFILGEIIPEPIMPLSLSSAMNSSKNDNMNNTVQEKEETGTTCITDDDDTDHSHTCVANDTIDKSQSENSDNIDVKDYTKVAAEMTYWKELADNRNDAMARKILILLEQRRKDDISSSDDTTNDNSNSNNNSGSSSSGRRRRRSSSSP